MESCRAPTKTAVIPTKGPRLRKMDEFERQKTLQKRLATTVKACISIADQQDLPLLLISAVASNRGGFFFK